MGRDGPLSQTNNRLCPLTTTMDQRCTLTRPQHWRHLQVVSRVDVPQSLETLMDLGRSFLFPHTLNMIISKTATLSPMQQHMLLGWFLKFQCECCVDTCCVHSE